jgi:hypothetical protein
MDGGGWRRARWGHDETTLIKTWKTIYSRIALGTVNDERSGLFAAMAV